MSERAQALEAALRAVMQFMAPDVPRGPSSDGWQNSLEMAQSALAAPAEGVSPQPDLHAAIMNLRCVVPSDVDDADVVTGSLSGTHALAYKRGHRDARHAAAELAMEASAPVSPVEPTPNDTLLRNIRMAAAMGLSFGHQATPQPMERMVERKDKRLRQILTLLAEHGVTGSMLRAESNAPVEPTPEPPQEKA